MARGGHPVRGARPARGRRRGRRQRGQVEVEWQKHLTLDTKKAMRLLGQLAMDDIEDDARSKGRRGTGKAFPPLDPRYARQKAKEGRAPFPDLYRTGELWRSFRIKRITDDEVWVGFDTSTGEQVKKFRRLKKQGRDPLGLSKADLNRFAKELIRRGLLKEEHGPPPRTPRAPKR